MAWVMFFLNSSAPSVVGISLSSRDAMMMYCRVWRFPASYILKVLVS